MSDVTYGDPFWQLVSPAEWKFSTPPAGTAGGGGGDAGGDGGGGGAAGHESHSMRTYTPNKPVNGAHSPALG